MPVRKTSRPADAPGATSPASARPRPPGARKSEMSRGQILKVAARLFRDQGYAATSLRQIATAAEQQSD